MIVYVVLISGKIIILDVNPTDTLRSFKNQLLQLEGLPSDSYRLCSLTQMPLSEDDGKTLEQINFQGLHGHQVHLVPREPIDILVRTLTSNQYLFEGCNTSDLIGEFKFKVKERIGVVPDYQRYVIRGRDAEDMKSFAHYGGRESLEKKPLLVHLVLRLRGASS